MTAQAYLISLNLGDLLHFPQSAIKVFDQQYRRSGNPIDKFDKASFERLLRTCDLT